MRAKEEKEGENAAGEYSLSYAPFPGNPLYPLPFWLLNCGCQRTCSPSYNWPGARRRPSLIWQYTLAGEGSLEADGQTYRLVPGQAFLLTTPDDHRYYLPPDAGAWEFVYVTLDGAGAQAAGTALRRAYGPVLSLAATSPTVAAARDIRERLQHHGYGSPYEIADAAGHFLYTLTLELEESASSPEPEFMRRIYRALQRDPGLDMAGLAAAAGYSRRYLDRRFRDHTGESPATFLRRIRLQQAAQLLENSLLSVKEIAARCGFYDAPYFCRQFAARYGRTPAAYRKR